MQRTAAVPFHASTEKFFAFHLGRPKKDFYVFRRLRTSYKGPVLPLRTLCDAIFGAKTPNISKL